MAQAHYPQGLLDLLLDTLKKYGIDEGPRPTADPTEQEPDDGDVAIETVGAWAGTSTYGSASKVKQTIALCKELGLNRIDIIVNDHSKWRKPTSFTTFDLDKIAALVEAAQSAGVQAHLMTWLMPYDGYIEQAAEILVPYCKKYKITSLVFDAEEPYTQATGQIDYNRSADNVAERFSEIEWGVTGIGYTPVSKLGRLVTLSKYAIVQAYATRGTSEYGILPSNAVPKLVGRWRKLWPNTRIEIGLAAYNQYGIPGYTVESALRTSFGTAQADLKASTAVYWSLAQIRQSMTARRVIASLTRG